MTDKFNMKEFGVCVYLIGYSKKFKTNANISNNILHVKNKSVNTAG
jgi:hypothetical protein